MLDVDLNDYVGFSRVNEPKIIEGMIAVYYDNGWKKANTNNSGNNWYDYSVGTKKWANVVTVKETDGTKTRAEYMTAGVGTQIAEEDILSMWVWIPRYAYKITGRYHNNGNGSIEIKFLIGTIDDYEGGQAIRSSVTNGEDFVVHPAFTNDLSIGGMDKEIGGFWVAKFEASNSTAEIDNANLQNNSVPAPTNDQRYGGGNVTSLEVTIRPNVTSWRCIDVNNIYTVCKAMNAGGNIHGLTTDIDTMMMKNSQWGAVAYLTQSNYGNKQTSVANSGMWNNNYFEGNSVENIGQTAKAMYYTTLTGMTGVGRDDGTSADFVQTSKTVNTQTIEITGNVITYPSGVRTVGSALTKTYYRYHTNEGQRGSTTGNIYGIYDMAGGAWEYMASFLEDGTTSWAINFKNNIAEKYRTMYAGDGATTVDSDKTINYEANSQIYGDAVWETSANGVPQNQAWNGDFTNFPCLASPFIHRGNYFELGSWIGVFAFSYWTGNVFIYSSFRPIAL